MATFKDADGGDYTLVLAPSKVEAYGNTLRTVRGPILVKVLDGVVHIPAGRPTSEEALKLMRLKKNFKELDEAPEPPKGEPELPPPPPDNKDGRPVYPPTRKAGK